MLEVGFFACFDLFCHLFAVLGVVADDFAEFGYLMCPLCGFLALLLLPLHDGYDLVAHQILDAVYVLLPEVGVTHHV